MPARMTPRPTRASSQALAGDVPGDPGEDRLGQQDQRGAAGWDAPLAPHLQRERDPAEHAIPVNTTANTASAVIDADALRRGGRDAQDRDHAELHAR